MEATRRKKTKGIDLQNAWTVYVDLHPPQAVIDQEKDFTRYLVRLGRFDTITGFWRFWNNLNVSDDLFAKFPPTSNLRMFKSSVKPTFEDKQNAHGGEWVMVLDKDIVQYSWLELATAIVGEVIHDQICGIMLSWRQAKIRVRIWSSTCDYSDNDDVHWRIKHALHVSQTSKLSYVPHSAKPQYKVIDSQPGLPPATPSFPEGLSGKSTLKYDSDFLRRFSIFETCKRPPTDLANVDWEAITKEHAHFSKLRAELPLAGEEGSPNHLEEKQEFEQRNDITSVESVEKLHEPGSLSAVVESNSEMTPIQKRLDALRIKLPKQALSDRQSTTPFVEKLSPLPPVKLGSCNNEGGPERRITQSDIEKELSAYRDSYGVELVEKSHEDVLKILDAEGCPKCLRGVDDYTGPYVVLRCKLLQCPHVLHLPCVRSSEPGSTPRRSRPVTSLKRYHCTSYFRIVPVADQDPDSSSIPRDPPGTRRNCTIELEMSHILSDATALRINWPHTISSLMDHRSGQEFLLLSLENSGSTPRKKLSTLPLFRAKRGRIIFKCIDHSMKQEFTHDSNYDITKCGAGVNSLKLVLVHPLSRNTLTIGIKRHKSQEKKNEPSDAFVLSFVKYEFCAASALQSPIMVTVPSHHYTAPMSPLSAPLQSPPVMAVSPVLLGSPRVSMARVPFQPQPPIQTHSPIISPLPSPVVNDRKSFGTPVFPPSSPVSMRKINQTTFQNLPPPSLITTSSPVSPRLALDVTSDANEHTGSRAQPLPGPFSETPSPPMKPEQEDQLHAARFRSGSKSRFEFVQDTPKVSDNASGFMFHSYNEFHPQTKGQIPISADRQTSVGLHHQQQRRQQQQHQHRLQHSAVNSPVQRTINQPIQQQVPHFQSQSQHVSPLLLHVNPSTMPNAHPPDVVFPHVMNSPPPMEWRHPSQLISGASTTNYSHIPSINQIILGGGNGGTSVVHRGGLLPPDMFPPPTQLSNAQLQSLSRYPPILTQTGSVLAHHVSSGLNHTMPAVSQGGGPAPNTVLEHVRGRVFMLSKSQSGSRFVQEKLSDPVYFNMFFEELKGKVAELMMDNFGHYAIEALLSGCTDEQRLILVMNLSPQIGTVACHKQGSFSIQAMMDTMRSQTQIQCLCNALSVEIGKIILNCSGHYVILRFLQRFGYPYTLFIHRAICEHTVEFAGDHYGLRVLKAVVDAGPASEIRDVFAALVKHTNQLVENQYGNYIIQHLLEGAPPAIQESIKQKMNGKFVRFAKQKFSSNVVEKCLRHSKTDWKHRVIRQLLASAGELISDKYGNYCLQTALAAADRQMVQEFTNAVTPHLGSLRENVKVKWKKILETANKKTIVQD